MGVQIVLTKMAQVACPSCGIAQTRRHGFTTTKTQRRQCGECGLTFNADNAVGGMRAEVDVVGVTLDLFYQGESLGQIRKRIAQEYARYPSGGTLHGWVERWTGAVVDSVASDRPEISEPLAVAAIELDGYGTSGSAVDVVDMETRFIVATEIYPGASAAPAAESVVEGVSQQIGVGFQQLVPLDTRPDWLDAMLSRRDRILRRLKKPERIQMAAQGFRVHHNYMTPQDWQEGRTSAEAAGIPVRFRDWVGALRWLEAETSAELRGTS